MTNTKQELLAGLRAIFDRWENLLAKRSEQELTARKPSTDWSIGDVVAHLMAWQQVSVARLQAALAGAEPGYPDWLGGADPFFAEEHFDDFNARVWRRYRDQPWPTVHRMWQEGFRRFIELAEALPEDTLADAGRFAWLKGYPLSAVLAGSLEHHEHHYDSVSARLA